MADIVLVQPVVDVEIFKDKPSLPLALLCAASLVKRKYSVKIIDQRTSPDWKSDLLRELKKKPICVGTTSMTGGMLRYAVEISRFVKENSGVPLVWGGVHASLLPEQTIRHRDIDYVVHGEGEQTFYELVTALDKGRSVKKIRGLWYKEKGKPRFTGERPFLDMNKLPEVPYDLVNVHDYIQTTEGRKTIILQTSRGCPFRCAFCYNLVFNKSRWRALTVKKSLERIRKVVEEFGVEHIKFHDDDFFVDMERTRKILEGMVKYNITWESEGGRINYLERMDDAYLKLMDRSGCKRLYIGVESASDRILKMIHKAITVSQVRRVSKKVVKYNFEPYYNFMVGFPTETQDDIRKTIDLAFYLLQENPRARVTAFAIYTPYPGTELYTTAVRKGLRIPRTLEGWCSYDFDKVNLPWASGKKRKMLKYLYFTSRFIDKKSRTYFNSAFLRLLADLYRPLARYRVRNLFFRGMFEWRFKGLYERRLQK